MTLGPFEMVKITDANHTLDARLDKKVTTDPYEDQRLGW